MAEGRRSPPENPAAGVHLPRPSQPGEKATFPPPLPRPLQTACRQWPSSHPLHREDRGSLGSVHRLSLYSPDPATAPTVPEQEEEDGLRET